MRGGKSIVHLNANLEIKTWISLLIVFVAIGLVVYAFRITAKLRKYEKLYRSQADITESISILTSNLNSALEEIKALRKIESAGKDSE